MPTAVSYLTDFRNRKIVRHGLKALHLRHVVDQEIHVLKIICMYLHDL